MAKRGLKLKQASAVLQVQPKELQNFVQFGVVRPHRSEGAYVFDRSTLLAATVAFYLKESLGTRISVLCKLMEAFSESQASLTSGNPRYITFNCRLVAGEEPIKLGVPLRTLDEQMQKRMSHAEIYRDLPPGRKRRGWKKEFLKTLAAAAKDMGEISEEEILRTVRSYRQQRRAREITVVAES
jgi:hypothetical protein